jgi:hypothetical protein
MVAKKIQKKGETRGRKTLYRREFVDIIRRGKGAGLTNEIIAKMLGIGESTLALWREKHEAVRKAYQDGEVIALDKVKSKLFMLTQGYATTRTKKARVMRGEGKTRMVVTESIHDSVGPSGRAIEFYLTNKDPKNWKHRQDQTIRGADNDYDNWSDEQIEEELQRLEGAKGTE